MCRESRARTPCERIVLARRSLAMFVTQRYCRYFATVMTILPSLPGRGSSTQCRLEPAWRVTEP